MKHVFYEHIETLNRQPWGQWRWSTPRNIQVSKFKNLNITGEWCGGLGYYFPGYRAGVITISWQSGDDGELLEVVHPAAR